MELVSVIIPTFNRAGLIPETLESIIAQTYTHWECIIVDDGSSDATETVIREYIRKDTRFHYFSRPENRMKGANACRNYGFEKSNGTYVKWFDSDDIMYPDFLEKQVRILENNKELDFCICLADGFVNGRKEKNIFRANRNPEHDPLTALLTKNHYFFTAAPLWNRNVLEGMELFDESLFNSHETDFHFRMLSENLKYRYTDDVLFSIRRGHSSITQEESNVPESHLSRLSFFLKAFEITERSDIKEKNRLKQYILYRQLSIFYMLRTAAENHKTNLGFSKMLRNISRTSYPPVIKIQIYIGFLLAAMAGKGYTLLKKSEIDIMDPIEN